MPELAWPEKQLMQLLRQKMVNYLVDWNWLFRRIQQLRQYLILFEIDYPSKVLDIFIFFSGSYPLSPQNLWFPFFFFYGLCLFILNMYLIWQSSSNVWSCWFRYSSWPFLLPLPFGEWVIAVNFDHNCYVLVHVLMVIIVNSLWNDVGWWSTSAVWIVIDCWVVRLTPLNA